MKQVIQSYMKAMVALQGLPYQNGNTIKIGEHHVIAFRGDAESYTDVLSAYVTGYDNNKHLGNVSDLIRDYAFLQKGFDDNLSDLPICLLEWIDSDGTTATERSCMEPA
tara:strand:- start:105 stop:431 length:327 start_codon:yes stop_codon:yes gene_type:complete